MNYEKLALEVEGIAQKQPHLSEKKRATLAKVMLSTRVYIITLQPSIKAQKN